MSRLTLASVLPFDGSRGVRLKKRRLFYVVCVALSVLSISYVFSAQQAEYERKCLSGFSEKNNKAGIVDYYKDWTTIDITEDQVAISRVEQNEYGTYDYEYSVLGGRGSGFATGNNCGHEEISPEGPVPLK
ncbi:hypothetical protein M2267_004191 [Ensifer sp. KUDG1]|uniref:hypothetical protein n=1 Tax=Ensifer sp. KUDG1 TaxID=3373919 RepID=UPI003D2097F1